tara:strand:+ start:33 stop:581 length:549 start_codon:yes stop_codon:yes gene_type:complete
MKKFFLILFFILTINEVYASTKNNIIKNLKDINNFTFNFEQNINGKKENGNCVIQYPKKIFCKYNSQNQKILVSNGKSLVIKTLSSFYLYPLEKTPLDLILDKDFIINKIKKSEENIIDNKFINFRIFENENEINIFFDKNTYDLIGWQTLDIYQNLSITYLSSINKNNNLNKKLFELPTQN